MTTPKLFETAPRSEWQSNVEVGGAGASLYLYALGYAKAASALVDQTYAAENEGKGKSDVLFYPICYLYRHSLELILKDLLFDLERFLRFLVWVGNLEMEKTCPVEKLEEKLGRQHSLQGLLDCLVLKLGYAGGEKIDPSVIKAVQALHDEDPNGQRFRYSSIKKDGGNIPSFASNTHINLQNVKDTIEPAIEYLRDGVGGWLDDQLSRASENLGYCDNFDDPPQKQFEEDMRADYELEMGY